MSDHPTHSPAPASGAETPEPYYRTLHHPSCDWRMASGGDKPPCNCAELSAASTPESPREIPTPPSDAGPRERETVGSTASCIDPHCTTCHPAAPAAEGPRAVKRPVHCGSGHPDGYLCELAPSHAGEHRAFIDAHDEQGKIPELSWTAPTHPGAEGPRDQARPLGKLGGAKFDRDNPPAAALPGAEAEASATLDTDEGEGARTVNRTTGAEAPDRNLARLSDALAFHTELTPRLQAMVEARDAEVARLTAEPAELLEELTDLRVDHLRAHEEVARLTSEVARLTKNHAKQTALLVASDEENERLRDENARLISEVRALTEQRNSAQAYLDGLLDDASELLRAWAKHPTDSPPVYTAIGHLREMVETLSRLASPSPTGAE